MNPTYFLFSLRRRFEKLRGKEATTQDEIRVFFMHYSSHITLTNDNLIHLSTFKDKNIYSCNNEHISVALLELFEWFDRSQYPNKYVINRQVVRIAEPLGQLGGGGKKSTTRTSRVSGLT